MSSSTGSRRWLTWGLILCGIVLVAWVRSAPMRHMPSSQKTFVAEDGREYPYLPGYDSYDWLRAARNVVRSGTPCDAIVAGVCRDTQTLAPVGAPMEYPHSPHVWAIATVHRILTRLQPGTPLSASAFWVPVLIGALGVLPAFAIGRRLAGEAGGLAAAIGVGLSPIFLARSVTADNDVWNVVLPLFLVWAAGNAASATRTRTRVLYAATGMFAIGVHALIWRGWVFAYAVTVAGLALNAVADALAGAPRARFSTGRAVLGRATAAFGWFTIPPAIAALGLGLRPADLLRHLEGSRALLRAGGSAAATDWPRTLATVGELRRPPLNEIADLAGGPAFLLVGWLGLLLLFLPRRDWAPRHFATFLGGNLLCWFLLAGAAPSRSVLLVLLLLSLGVCLWLRLGEDVGRQAADAQPMAVLVLVWFLAALFLAFDGLRFTLLLAAPLGIAFGVAVGRLGDWAERTIAPHTSATAAAVVPFAVAVVTLLMPVQRAAHTMAAVAPRMNDAWWDTLTTLKAQAPSDAVLHVWWPNGFFAKYFAERPVSADGASLSTHVPYWLAQALFADDERKSVGLLRMLGCGSDATPHDEKHLGAFYQLLAGGLDWTDALAATTKLSSLDLAAAREYVRHHDLREQVLDATHCDPPAAYLVLSDELSRSNGLRHLGSWSFEKAFLVRQVRSHGTNSGATQAARRFGLSQSEAEALAERAAALRGDADTAAFVAPTEALLTDNWVSCDATAGGSLRCPLQLRLPALNLTVESFTYDGRGSGILHWRRGQTSGRAVPAQILIADTAELVSTALTDPLDPRLAVLVDPGQSRILVGSPRLLRSTLTQLLFLDGRYSKSFEKVEEHSTSFEHVSAWRIRWPESERIVTNGDR